LDDADAARQAAVAAELTARFEAAGIVVARSETAGSYRAGYRAQFDTLVVLLMALAGLTALVGGLGLGNTMALNVLERSREIGILRSLGVDRGGVRRTVLAEAGLIGLIANVAGALAGLALSLILIHVINKQSFGWTIRFVFPGRLILGYAAITVGASVLAGLLPAWHASRLPIADAVRYA